MAEDKGSPRARAPTAHDDLQKWNTTTAHAGVGLSEPRGSNGSQGMVTAKNSQKEGCEIFVEFLGWWMQ